MSESDRRPPDDAPMLLSGRQIAAFVLLFLLFAVIGRAVGGWLQGDAGTAIFAVPASPTPVIEQTATLEPA